MVPNKHRIFPTIIQMDETNINLITDIANINSVDSQLSSKNMNQKQKYEASFRIAQELSNLMKKLKHPLFLTFLCDLIEKKTYFR